MVGCQLGGLRVGRKCVLQHYVVGNIVVKSFRKGAIFNIHVCASDHRAYRIVENWWKVIVKWKSIPNAHQRHKKLLS